MENFNLKNLFAIADKKINEREREDRVKAEEARIAYEREKTERQLRIRKNTEEYAKSVLGLVYDTLSNADKRRGWINIEKYGNMGKPIKTSTYLSIPYNDYEKDSNDLADMPTGYEINDNGLTIGLNLTVNAKGNFDEKREFNAYDIDFDYLNELLAPSSISVEKIEKREIQDGDYCVDDVLIIKITAKREKIIGEAEHTNTI